MRCAALGFDLALAAWPRRRGAAWLIAGSLIVARAAEAQPEPTRPAGSQSAPRPASDSPLPVGQPGAPESPPPDQPGAPASPPPPDQPGAPGSIDPAAASGAAGAPTGERVAPSPVGLPQPSAAGRAAPRDEARRPSGLALGIGLGYVFPTSLQTPNAASVRVRLPGGLTFEPQLVLATSVHEVDASGTTRQSELTLGALARYPVKRHRRADLELVASASLSGRVTDPPGDHNSHTVSTLGLGYGVAVGYWFSPHWTISLTAANPLVSYTRDHQERAGNQVAIEQTTTLGLIFDPEITLMVHLYD